MWTGQIETGPVLSPHPGKALQLETGVWRHPVPSGGGKQVVLRSLTTKSFFVVHFLLWKTIALQDGKIKSVSFLELHLALLDVVYVLPFILDFFNRKKVSR